ncbi:sulfatase [Aquidulcibacter sp.]|uniref:sulfatase family protein n=1 Tax=Aquidulcibacter sp. TaxID=2052990 RepID=UPI003BA5C039
MKISNLKAALIMCVALAVASLNPKIALAQQASSKAQKQPNIIVILADDLGFGDLGSFGGRTIRTPNLDRMAREGGRLTRFFASANVCTPSRAGLLTGRYAARSGLAVGVIYPHSAYGLPESEVTLPELLVDAGYRTAMLGKWHLGSVASAWPTRHGFQSFWGVPWSNDMNPLPLYRDMTILEEPLVQETFAERLVEEAKGVINSPSDKPFFLYVAHIAPHVPLRPGPAFRGKSQQGLYGDFVEEMDWTTGEILKALKAAGKDQDTLVIFTSDNGPWWEGSSGPLRDRKGSTYEGAYGVPFIARWPGKIPSGTVSDQMSMNIDLLPTLAALAGAKVPTDRVIDGQNIWPILSKRGAVTPHDKLYFFSNANVAAVRTQDWRMVVRAYYLNFDAPLDQFNYRLLFNMKNDRGETVSLADRFPEIVDRLKAMIDAARAEFGAITQQRTSPQADGPIQLPNETRPLKKAP